LEVLASPARWLIGLAPQTLVVLITTSGTQLTIGKEWVRMSLIARCMFSRAALK
jgi:hypothetical protein